MRSSPKPGWNWPEQKKPKRSNQRRYSVFSPGLLIAFLVGLSVYSKFTLSTFCDGYIFQKHFKDYEGCTVDEKFVTVDNLKEAIAKIYNWEWRKRINAPEMIIDGMKHDADIKSRFRDLK